jgi:hypothetical protein
MKNRKNYIARSTATLTQSGLLAALLQHQRHKVIELSQRRAQREQVRGLLRNSSTWLLARYHSITAGRRFRRDFEGETIPRHTWIFYRVNMGMAQEIHTYADLLQKIHSDLRMQHPEWIQPNGESPMCDSYEARLMELLDASRPMDSNETTAVSHWAFEYGRTQIWRLPIQSDSVVELARLSHFK